MHLQNRCRLGEVKVSATGKMRMCGICGCQMCTMRPVLMRIVMLIVIVTLHCNSDPIRTVSLTLILNLTLTLSCTDHVKPGFLKRGYGINAILVINVVSTRLQMRIFKGTKGVAMTTTFRQKYTKTVHLVVLYKI